MLARRSLLSLIGLAPFAPAMAEATNQYHRYPLPPGIATTAVETLNRMPPPATEDLARNAAHRLFGIANRALQASHNEHDHWCSLEQIKSMSPAARRHYQRKYCRKHEDQVTALKRKYIPWSLDEEREANHAGSQLAPPSRY